MRRTRAATLAIARARTEAIREFLIGSATRARSQPHFTSQPAIRRIAGKSGWGGDVTTVTGK